MKIAYLHILIIHKTVYLHLLITDFTGAIQHAVFMLPNGL